MTTTWPKEKTCPGGSCPVQLGQPRYITPHNLMARPTPGTVTFVRWKEVAASARLCNLAESDELQQFLGAKYGDEVCGRKRGLEFVPNPGLSLTLLTQHLLNMLTADMECICVWRVPERLRLADSYRSFSLPYAPQLKHVRKCSQSITIANNNHRYFRWCRAKDDR
ncbi:DNA-binding protein [Anopheles sinensis]|uniref:DNA-binding protein n=1 Tax=Anopheles sinensis TaxID=74873 RepID=A0A084VF88_ANOSI|nr:DNA-binding protein [Anopheles sinensis]